LSIDQGFGQTEISRKYSSAALKPSTNFVSKNFGIWEIAFMASVPVRQSPAIDSATPSSVQNPHRLVQPHFRFWHVTESGMENNRIERMIWKNLDIEVRAC